jgi:hypothetical protein
MLLDMQSSPRCGAKPAEAPRANRRRCRTGAAGCTAAYHRAPRKGIKTPTSTAGMVPKHLRCGGCFLAFALIRSSGCAIYVADAFPLCVIYQYLVIRRGHHVR